MEASLSHFVYSKSLISPVKRMSQRMDVRSRYKNDISQTWVKERIVSMNSLKHWTRSDRNANSMQSKEWHGVHGYRGFYGANYTCDDQHDVITLWLGGEARLSTAWPIWISVSNNRPAFVAGLSDKGKDISLFDACELSIRWTRIIFRGEMIEFNSPSRFVRCLTNVWNNGERNWWDWIYNKEMYLYIYIS